MGRKKKNVRGRNRRERVPKKRKSILKNLQITNERSEKGKLSK